MCFLSSILGNNIRATSLKLVIPVNEVQVLPYFCSILRSSCGGFSFIVSERRSINRSIRLFPGVEDLLVVEASMRKREDVLQCSQLD